MLHLRLVVPTARTDAVCATLAEAVGVASVVVVPGAARRPAGDLVLCDVAREGASQLIEALRGHGLEQDGSIAVEPVDTVISQAARRAEAEAPGQPVNAVVWEEVEARTSEESALSATYLIFLVVATAVAAIGVLTDSPILIVGAMVVGPEFGPVAGLCVALIQRRPAEGVRSLLALVIGFPVAIAVTAGLALLGAAAGLTSRAMLEAARPLTAFIWHPNAFSFIVAFLAGVAGMLSLTAAKSGALVGVLISITTVPAAANLALALAFADRAEAVGSALQLGINLGALLLAGTLTLGVQRSLADRQRRG